MTPRRFSSPRRCAAVLSVMTTGTLLAGCQHVRALNPAGFNARHISNLWWVFFWTTLIVYILVVVFMTIALTRDKSDISKQPMSVDPARERRITMSVITAVGFTAVIMFVLLISEFATGRTLHSIRDEANALPITLTGHRWWWEVRYDDPHSASNVVETANEIHVPVGRTVKINLGSSDVIHSFWIPNISGKKDLVPGHPAQIYIKAEKPGTYLGQCAEYCGYQHAHMRLVLVAHEPAEFDTWLTHERSWAREPTTAEQQRGKWLFEHTTCAMCHNITGAEAHARLGPNLTHVASRRYLAAGTIENTRGHLAGWIADPQKIKPGVVMPTETLPPDDLRDLMEYVSSLE